MTIETHTFINSFAFFYIHLHYILVKCPGVAFLQVEGCFRLSNYTSLFLVPHFAKRGAVSRQITLLPKDSENDILGHISAFPLCLK